MFVTKAGSKTKAITLVEAPGKRAMFEKEMRYDVYLHGVYYGDLYYNLRGYVGYLPTPDSLPLDIGEKSIAAYRREINNLNREFAAKGA